METAISNSKTNTDKNNPSQTTRPIPYLPHTEKDRQDMLSAIGVASFDEIIKSIPEKLRNFSLKLPQGKSEIEIFNDFNLLANQNTSLNKQISFLGGGVYNRYIPAVVGEILSKGEFYTAYTPYQPEASQGTLQAIYEFQTIICNLTGMDASNASVYDGHNAVIEAALMACRLTKRNKIILSKGLNPEAIAVSKTYTWGCNLNIDFVNLADGITDLKELDELLDDQTACFINANPNFAGCLEPQEKIAEIVHKKGALFINYIDLISLAVLKSPRDTGADIAVGDGQALGNYANYGGPHIGFISCLKEHIRQLPGRIVGITKDNKGNQAFTLTLQTREQHIRRENATSNICTNQSLNALAVLVYLTYMGPSGLKTIAEISLNRAHYLLEQLKLIKNYKPAFNSPFFNEFVLELPIKSSEFIENLCNKNILPGLDLNGIDGYKNNQILVSVTELNTQNDIDLFVQEVKNLK